MAYSRVVPMASPARRMRVKRAVIKKLGLVDPASSVHRSSLGGGGWLYLKYINESISL
jgi:hypothetical protein|nr:hypothetical protein Q903MT_gene2785 [Picea sitchensis]